MALLMFCVPMHAFFAPHNLKHAYQKEVEALEIKWRDAQVNRDIPTLDRMMAEDFIGITASGTVQTKEEMLSSITDGVFNLTKIDLSEMKARIHGETAVVTSKARVEGTNQGADISGTYRYTRVYVRKLGVWKIVNFEVTRIVPAGQASQGRVTADSR